MSFLLTGPFLEYNRKAVLKSAPEVQENMLGRIYFSRYQVGLCNVYYLCDFSEIFRTVLFGQRVCIIWVLL